MPLYTVAEAARFLGVPIVTAVSAARYYPKVLFIGLAEGMVVAAFRNAGVSMQHLRAAVAILEQEIGFDYALASRRLYTSGAEVLFDYAERQGDEELAGLTVVVSRQKVFAEVVKDYLMRIEYGADDWAERLVSPVTKSRIVVVDPARSFGQPIFARGAVRVEDVIDRWKAGDSLAEVAADFGVPLDDVEDYLRVAVPVAA